MLDVTTATKLRELIARYEHDAAIALSDAGSAAKEGRSASPVYWVAVKVTLDDVISELRAIVGPGAPS